MGWAEASDAVLKNSRAAPPDGAGCEGTEDVRREKLDNPNEFLRRRCVTSEGGVTKAQDRREGCFLQTVFENDGLPLGAPRTLAREMLVLSLGTSKLTWVRVRTGDMGPPHDADESEARL